MVQGGELGIWVIQEVDELLEDELYTGVSLHKLL